MSHASRSLKVKLGTYRRFKLPQVLFHQDIEEFYIALDTPVSLSCYMLFVAGEYRQLVEKEIEPGNYNDPGSFSDDYSAISFLRKNRFLDAGIDKRAVALQKFREAEDSCRSTNRRFRNLALDPNFKGPNVWLLSATIRKIGQILATHRDDDGIISSITPQFVEEFFGSGAFGPGASTLITGPNTSSVRKFREEREITASLYRLVGPCLKAAYPLWFRDGQLSEVRFRETSKVITVPKNAKTDRTIAVEPGLNIWFQKSIGRMIRRRLRKNGLELNSDEKNARLSRLGSRDGSFATVDFSSASDTISAEVVRVLLPPLWYEILSAARTANYVLNNETRTFEKFSSMGNGFTFELESLIFYAAALCTTEYLGLDTTRVSVFGDDVVLPCEAYSVYSEFCSFLGFTVNHKKSFSNGYFRESCGSYWFHGHDVKPYFLQKVVQNANSSFNFANSILDLSHRRAGKDGCDRRFEKLHRCIVSQIPAEIRVRGDVSGGAGCIHSNWDEAHPRRVRGQVEGFYFDCFHTPPIALSTDSPAVLVARLGNNMTSEQELRETSVYAGGVVSVLRQRNPYWFTDRREFNNSYNLRNVTTVIFKRKTFVRQWYNFGPWV